MLTDKWTRQQRNQADRLVRCLLDGVGGLIEVAQLYPFAYHLRRGLTDEEISGLDETWCAIPAVDEGGTPEEIRAALVELGVLVAGRNRTR